MDRAEKDRIVKGRRCWQPKMPEVEGQCASCPFREDVAPFHEVLKLVAAANGHPEPDRFRAGVAVMQVKYEDAVRGDFACHLTVYEPDYRTLRPTEDRRQCAGASKWFREGGDL